MIIHTHPITHNPMPQPTTTPEQARTQGFEAVASEPQHAPRNPYSDDAQPELHEAWEAGAIEAGICSRYTNGILDPS